MAIFETIKLDKTMYANREGFSAALEKMDPSVNYAGTELAGLDAFQRQLKRFDIKVSGANSDLVEKFFQCSESAALFPEYVSRAVNQGISEASKLENLVATVTKVNGFDYRTITSDNLDDSFDEVGEGSEIPQTIIRTKENLVNLRKRGRMLVATYEAIRFQRLDLFTVTLRQIGAYIANAQIRDAVEVIMEGDGNDNAAEVLNTATSGTLTYADLLMLWGAFESNEMNTMVVSPAMMQRIMNLEEMKAPNANLDFLTTGKLSTPFGATILRSNSVPDDKIIALDRRYALEMVQAGDLLLDYDKLIDRQMERATISCITGFAKIFQNASKVLSLNG